MTNDGARLAIVAAAGLAVGLAALYLAKRARDASSSLASAAGAIGAALDPTSRENLAYRGVNAAGAAVAGRDFALGADIRDAAEAGIGASGTGILPLDFVVDSVLYPINAAVRAVRGTPKPVEVPSAYAWTSQPESPFSVGA